VSALVQSSQGCLCISSVPKFKGLQVLSGRQLRRGMYGSYVEHNLRSRCIVRLIRSAEKDAHADWLG
jgi:hypothetical protein